MTEEISGGFGGKALPKFAFQSEPALPATFLPASKSASLVPAWCSCLLGACLVLLPGAAA